MKTHREDVNQLMVTVGWGRQLKLLVTRRLVERGDNCSVRRWHLDYS
jgi:hypothetical protein